MMISFDKEFIIKVLGEFKYNQGISITTKQRCIHKIDTQCTIEEYLRYMSFYSNSIEKLIALSDIGNENCLVASSKDSCELCNRYKGIVKIKNAKVGINVPPFGVFCRCIIVYDTLSEML